MFQLFYLSTYLGIYLSMGHCRIVLLQYLLEHVPLLSFLLEYLLEHLLDPVACVFMVLWSVLI